jgi:hypothetical protein
VVPTLVTVIASEAISKLAWQSISYRYLGIASPPKGGAARNDRRKLTSVSFRHRALGKGKLGAGLWPLPGPLPGRTGSHLNCVRQGLRVSALQLTDFGAHDLAHLLGGLWHLGHGAGLEGIRNKRPPMSAARFQATAWRLPLELDCGPVGLWSAAWRETR